MDLSYPLSGLKGDLLRWPPFESASVSARSPSCRWTAGSTIDSTINETEPAPFSDRLDFTGNVTTDIEDLVIGTKLRLVTEASGRPRLGSASPRACPMPATKADSAWTRWTSTRPGWSERPSIDQGGGNAGIGILGDPTRGDELSRRAHLRPVRRSRPPPGQTGVGGKRPGAPRRGTMPRGRKIAVRSASAAASRPVVRFDGAIIVGLTSRDSASASRPASRGSSAASACPSGASRSRSARRPPLPCARARRPSRAPTQLSAACSRDASWPGWPAAPMPVRRMTMSGSVSAISVRMTWTTGAERLHRG